MVADDVVQAPGLELGQRRPLRRRHVRLADVRVRIEHVLVGRCDVHVATYDRGLRAGGNHLFKRSHPRELVLIVLGARHAPVVFMPDLIRWIFGSEFLGAVNAARLFVLAAAVQLVVGWTKSFPVTIGRPGLRIVTHGLETIVVLPLVLLLGSRWGAAGAAGAVLAGMCVFALAWAIVFVRMRPEDVGPPVPLDEALADTESETGALVR